VVIQSKINQLKFHMILVLKESMKIKKKRKKLRGVLLKSLELLEIIMKIQESLLTKKPFMKIIYQNHKRL